MQKLPVFRESVQSADTLGQAHTCVSDADVNRALAEFNKCVLECAQCIEMHVPCGQLRRKTSWFDHECVLERRKVRGLLRKVRKVSSPEIRHEYQVARREYKRLLKRKKSEYNGALKDSLVKSVDNQVDFLEKFK
ncbi:hypothetical protein BaRGS_00038493 [Batillaria attramentaria]|uniref:Uncharacterized protein n=1 Tax=Batillaria attramentaria TaxID=370345 RepID=A0ABD0J5M8_9CAEN